MTGVPFSFSQESDDPSYLFSENAYYIEDLYARYLKDPNAVPQEWRDYFVTIQDGLPDAREAAAAAMRTARTPAPVPGPPTPPPSVDALKQTAVLRLITVYRVRGHQQADVDPLRLYPRPPVPDLDPAFHNLDDARESFENSDEVAEYTLRHFPALTPEQALNDLLGSPALLRSAARRAGLDPENVESLRRPRTAEIDLDRRRWSDADAALLDELLSLVGPPATTAVRPPDTSSGPRTGAEVDGTEAVDPLFHRHEADEFELADRQDSPPLPSIDPFERPDEVDDEAGVPSYADPYYDDEPDDPGDALDRVAPSVSKVEAIEELAAAEIAAEDPLAADGRPAPEYDGAPAQDLELEAVDSVAEESVTIVELAEAERSWRFGHVIVDEAQDLTPMQWRMVARRCSGGALTVVGDLAQRRGSPVASWSDLIPDELPRFDVRELTVNYRSPAENDDVTSSVLTAISPDLTLARSLRRSGFAPLAVRTARPVDEALGLAASELGRGDALRVAVITGDAAVEGRVAADDALSRDLGDRLAVLAPAEAKGLEFDSVIVIEPAAIASRRHGLNLLYVAVTRPTQRLIVVHRDPLPWPLANVLTS